MKYKVTHRIHPEEIHEIVGINYIALGLAHFAVPLQKPGMAEHLLRQRLP